MRQNDLDGNEKLEQSMWLLYREWEFTCFDNTT